MDHFHIRRSKAPPVLFDETACFFFSLNGINSAVHDLQRQLDRYGTGARSHVIDHRIPGQMQFCHGKASDLAFRHGGFSAQKLFVVHTGAHAAEMLRVFHKSHTESVITSVFQFLRLSRSDLFFRVSKPFPDVKTHMGETIFLQFSAKIAYAFRSAQYGKGLLMGPNRPHQIGLPAMSAFQTYILPCQMQLPAEIRRRRNAANTPNLTVTVCQRLIQPFRSAVKTDVAGQKHCDSGILRMGPDVICDSLCIIVFVKRPVCMARRFQHPSGSDEQVCFFHCFCRLHRHAGPSAHADTDECYDMFSGSCILSVMSRLFRSLLRLFSILPKSFLQELHDFFIRISLLLRRPSHQDHPGSGL